MYLRIYPKINYGYPDIDIAFKSRLNNHWYGHFMDIHNSILNILNYLRISNIQLGISKNKLWISLNTFLDIMRCIYGYRQFDFWISLSQLNIGYPKMYFRIS